MRVGIEGQRLFRQKKHGMDFVALELVKNILDAVDVPLIVTGHSHFESINKVMKAVAQA